MLQILLGTASVAFVFLTAREWFGARAAWISAGLATLTGLFTFYESLILQSSIDAFLTSAALLALTFALRRDRNEWFAVAGFVFGMQTLNRPNVLLAAIGLAVLLIVTRRLRPAAILLAGLLVSLLPVAARNVLVSKQWTLLSSHGGLNFYIGNGENATGFYRQIPGVRPTIEGQETDVRRVAEAAVGRTLSDAEVSDYFVGLARSWMTQHPGDAALLFAKKFAYVFSAQHIALPHSYPFYAYDAGTALRFLAVGPWLLLPLGIVGLVAADSGRPRSGYLIWASFVPLYGAAVAIFFVAERYRLPLLVPLCVGAGAAVDAALRQVAAKRPASLLSARRRICCPLPAGQLAPRAE